ncbi:MAG: pyridoxamine 5'-phosphate oxidase family protein [Rhodocyclaceae bacterium]|jgi:pyridoxamine 5'-phosphate oxidase|nr:pyridoxamine 5'-phosphate oxidase family protein [Rhodocyclaceae bacterium]MCE2979470.1 pyridoxamine 5'-phosphate oxidase family protein [Betaproteobacteria bacterium]MCA3074211.1 pyridoxamine 5'-phosphate oxidase family protein [Rhodocyclaceae bacterium]MCA3095068.1 pyridoxamine 5'-phosphate oxidase family protein [Rhodocyclaceae bacterium]MCA3099411.1 pyridoxamine 5'-phosphate oxidase family protein [Rhodocyclaceae bacterium]
MGARAHAIGEAGARSDAGPVPAFLFDLSLAEAHAWGMLERGAADRRSPCHAPSVATLSDEGPQVRTVTLRHADRAAATLRFNADARGGLVTQLMADPRAAVHAYDPAGKTQLRLRTVAALHRGDPLALSTWQATNPSAKRCYLVPPPGSPAGVPASGLPAPLERRRPTDTESDAGFAHFCVVELKIEAIEWLHLHAIHKRRARFERQGERWQGTWLTP